MKIARSTKCSLKFATAHKKAQWLQFLHEYVRVVNLYVVYFWDNTPLSNAALVKEVLNVVKDTWITQRAKQCAARQALDMVRAVKERARDKGSKTTPKRPKLRKLKAHLSLNCAELHEPTSATSFDLWLKLHSLGNGIILQIPLARHKHYNELAKVGVRLNQFIVTDKYIQIPFELNVGKKLPPTGVVAGDSGMHTLFATSTGELFGDGVMERLRKIRRKKHGSNGQKRARAELRQYIDRTVKEIMKMPGLSLLIIEDLKNITKGTKKKKRKLGKILRYFIGRWGVRYFHKRLIEACERNRVSFRRVLPFYSSQTCPIDTSHSVKREGPEFTCLTCGYKDNADITAAKILLQRFMNGKYSKGCIALPDKRKDAGLCSIRELSNSLVGVQDNAALQYAKALSTASV